MKKRAKFFLYLIISILLVFQFFSISTIQSNAASANYNIQNALNFSYENAYINYSWLCAEYVSRSLNAGGVNFTPQTTPKGLYQVLTQYNNFTAYSLKYSSSDSRLRSTGDNSGKVSPGDVIIIQGNDGYWLHAVIVSKIDSNGIIYYNAHNEFDKNGNRTGVKDGGYLATYSSSANNGKYYSGKNGTVTFTCLHYTGTFIDTTPPSITKFTVTEQANSVYKYSYVWQDNVGVVKETITLHCPHRTYSTDITNNPTDNKQYISNRSVDLSGQPDGEYYFEVNQWDAAGNKGTAFSQHFFKNTDSISPVISNVIVSDISDTGYTISCTVSDNVGITKVQFPTWTENNGLDDLIWHDGVVSGNTASCRINSSDHNYEKNCYYCTHIYAWDAAGNTTCVTNDSYPDLYLIVGNQGTEMTSGFGKTIPDGDYIIACAGNPDKTQYYYLDIEGIDVPAANQTNVSLCGLSANPSDPDIWTVSYENGFYTIKQKGTNMALDVYKADKKQGTNIQVWTFSGGSNQQWTISHNGNNGYRIQSRCSGLSIDMANGLITNGSNIIQLNGSNSVSQSWMFIPYKPKQPLANGKYIIESSLNNDYVLDIDEGMIGQTDTVNVQLEKYSSGNYSVFEITKLDNGYYKIINTATGKALDLGGGGSKLKDNINLYDSNGSIAQQWEIRKENGAYKLIARCSGLAMQVEDTVASNGCNVSQWTINGDKNQAWNFKKTKYSISYNANGGENAPKSQTKTYKKDISLSTSAPSNSGQKFLGWSTDKNATEADSQYSNGKSYSKDEDLVLYAVWKKENGSNNGNNNDNPNEDNDPIKAFVVRFYKVVLGRDGEETGINDWTNKLVTKEKTGCDVAKGFAMSQEFKNKNLGNEEFLKVMYKAFFDREPDTAGYNDWLNKLNSGVSREAVIAGFVNSTEFQNLCAKYGINSGRMELSNQNQQNNSQNNNQPNNKTSTLKLDASNVDESKLDEYVERLYKNILKRPSEAEGKEYWKKVIIEGKDLNGNEYDAATAARRGFFESLEYRNMQRTDDEFLTDLYWAFFDREPDVEGYTYWQEKMKNGYTRQQVIDEGFGHSKEFKNLLLYYGFKIIE